MRIATATYPIDWFDDWDAYEAKITRWVSEAAGNGAELLVFPEYGAMELASLAGEMVAGAVESGLRATADLKGRADELYLKLAVKHGVHILGASGPCYDGLAQPTNRAGFFAPNGLQAYQDKQIMTCGEREIDVRGAGPLKVLDTEIGKIGVVICYDCEFPALSRVLIEQGVEILLVPSCTEQLSGYWRVRIGAMARALESQCVVVHSPTMGEAPWNPVVAVNTGAAAIYGPPDVGFPDTGVIAQGAMNVPGWVYGDVSLEVIREVRLNGRVRNVSHWEEQASRVAHIEIIDMQS